MAGYPQRGNPIFGLATERGETEPSNAKDSLPYTVLGYANGPGGKRINGTRQNLTGVDTADKDYLQQATVWRGSETHAGDNVGALQNCWIIPPLFERLFLISWENNRDCHITMPLSLKTMEVQIKGDQ